MCETTISILLSPLLLLISSSNSIPSYSLAEIGWSQDWKLCIDAVSSQCQSKLYARYISTTNSQHVPFDEHKAFRSLLTTDKYIFNQGSDEAWKGENKKRGPSSQ
jgi:hypothetical protein